MPDNNYEKTFDIIFGRWKSQILYTGVRLGIFDCATSDVKTTSNIADELDLDENLAYRLLRALSSLGFLKEEPDRTGFSITPQGELLRNDHPQTLGGVILLEGGPEHYTIWKHLPTMIKDGKQNAFVREFGCNIFEYRDRNPKLKNKLFLTPELAPVFAAEDKDLLQMLCILTSVLDGHGFESDTGAQGHRGYNEDIMFTWLGAVVDIPFRVHKQLSQLGPKLYFYRLPKVQREEEYYFDQKDDDFATKVQAISQALGEYLDYFDANPYKVFDPNRDPKNELPKIALDNTKDEELAHRYIIRLGMLLAPLRAVVPTWETSAIAVMHQDISNKRVS